MEDDASNSTANLRRSLFPPENCPQVSDEAFNLFHAIDRELYTRLIQNLGRDPAASVQVMAFWIWLERETNDMNLIKRMLSLPPPLLNDVAEETETCLKCIETDAFHFGEITLLPSLLSGGGNSIVVNLRFLHENRIAVLRGVSKIINTVCSRAFSDILRRNWRAAAYHQAAAEGGPAAANGVPAVHFLGGGGVREVGESSREAAERRVIEGGGLAASPPIMRRMLFAPHMNVPFVPLPPPHVLTPGAHGGPPPAGLVADAIGIPVQMLAAAAAAGGSFPAYDLGAQRQMLSNELGELLSRNLSINTPMNHQETTNAVNSGGGVVVGDDGEEEEEVGPDDRTIFLTFSKGYPITEDEVREFFTRKFGDFIEDMIMQEVGEDEQVLYARMVARSTAVIDPIVGGNKAKYSINGKHVWARKYIKKSTSSPPRGDHNNPSSSSGQEAAVATGSPSS